MPRIQGKDQICTFYCTTGPKQTLVEEKLVLLLRQYSLSTKLDVPCITEFFYTGLWKHKYPWPCRSNENCFLWLFFLWVLPQAQVISSLIPWLILMWKLTLWRSVGLALCVSPLVLHLANSNFLESLNCQLYLLTLDCQSLFGSFLPMLSPGNAFWK